MNSDCSTRISGAEIKSRHHEPEPCVCKGPWVLQTSRAANHALAPSVLKPEYHLLQVHFIPGFLLTMKSATVVFDIRPKHMVNQLAKSRDAGRSLWGAQHRQNLSADLLGHRAETFGCQGDCRR